MSEKSETTKYRVQVYTKDFGSFRSSIFDIKDSECLVFYNRILREKLDFLAFPQDNKKYVKFSKTILDNSLIQIIPVEDEDIVDYKQ